MRPEFVALFSWCLASRLAELWWSQCTAHHLLEKGGRLEADDGFRFIAAVHALWLGLLLVEELAFGPSLDSVLLCRVALAAFVVAELLRAACILSLGRRWNVRVITMPGAAAVRAGPYRFLRHPNYVAVVIGLVSLPLALGLPLTAGLVLPLKLMALRRRIRVENAALDRAEAAA